MARRRELDKKIAEHYYTAKQAQEKLGMDKDKFNYTVRTRSVQRVPFLGGQGYYRREEIDGLAEEINAFLIIGRLTHFSYKVATLDTLKDEIHLAALNFGKARAERTLEARQRFLEANPQMTHYLYLDDDIVASINLLPLTYEAIEEFRKGKRAWLFEIEQIEQFEPGHRLHCALIDMMTTTRATVEQRYRYAAYLLKHLTRGTMVEWAKQGIDIATVDACGGTLDGENILKQARFQFMGAIECENRGAIEERRMYHLDVDTSDLPLLNPYKRALEEWSGVANHCH